MSDKDSTKVYRSFKYRIYPNATQTRALEEMLETHRRLYNECLELRTMAWEQYKSSVSFFDCARWFGRSRHQNKYFAALNVHSARHTLRRLDKAFSQFFKNHGSGFGYPKFAGRIKFSSVEFVYGDGAKLFDKTIRVHSVGKVRVKLHRDVEGKIKTVRLKREAGKWFVVFSCEVNAEKVMPNTLPAIGIDVGLESFLTTSDGLHEPNPRYLREALPALRIAQRSISRKQLGGSNRRKAIAVVQRVYSRVKNQRREHAYQVAHRLILAYGLIAVESLNVQGMLRNRRFSRAISDVAWSAFLNVLRHKAQKAGAQVVDVNPRGTSQECSGCGAEVKKALSEREHICPCCGLVLHRDVNAAKNILARGLARTGPAGANVSAQGYAFPEKPETV